MTCAIATRMCCHTRPGTQSGCSSATSGVRNWLCATRAATTTAGTEQNWAQWRWHQHLQQISVKHAGRLCRSAHPIACVPDAQGHHSHLITSPQDGIQHRALPAQQGVANAAQLTPRHTQLALASGGRGRRRGCRGRGEALLRGGGLGRGSAAGLSRCCRGL